MAEPNRSDWSRQFHDLLNSPLGVELIRVLEQDLHKSTIQSAEKSESMEVAYGLLKEASGVMLAVSHLKSKAVIPKASGNGGA